MNKFIDWLVTILCVIAILLLMAWVFELIFGLFSGGIPIWMEWILEMRGGM